MKRIINEGKAILKRLNNALDSEDVNKAIEEDDNLKELIKKWKKRISEENPKKKK
jgi:predicted GIY-YIG superfamily endonuclease